MKIKITKTDGTVIEFEGTNEEMNAAMWWLLPPALVLPQIPFTPNPFTAPGAIYGIGGSGIVNNQQLQAH